MIRLQKPKTAFGIWFTAFILVIALVTTGTIAWFVTNSEVSISSPSDQNLAVQINSGDLKVSVSYQQSDAEHYGQFTEYSPFGEEVNLTVQTPQFIDVTGNGKHLWFPSYLNDDGQPVFTDDESFSDVINRVEYCVNLRAKFKTSQSMNVYLDKSSFVSGVENVVGSSFARSSAYGNFSCDGIAGCVRVAFLEVENETETLKAVWIPNDGYCLTYGEDSSATFSVNGERESKYQYWDKNGSIMTNTIYPAYSINNVPTYANGKVLVGNSGLAVKSTSIVNYGAPLLSFTASGQTQEKELVIRIWFEGTDREADSALDGGKVKYNLCFTGIRKDTVTAAEQAAVDGITFYNNDFRWQGGTSCAPVEGVTQIYYSLDCIEWTPYGGWSAGHPIPAGNVYVRSAETSLKCPSGVHVVEVSY